MAQTLGEVKGTIVRWEAEAVGEVGAQSLGEVMGTVSRRGGGHYLERRWGHSL